MFKKKRGSDGMYDGIFRQDKNNLKTPEEQELSRKWKMAWKTTVVTGALAAGITTAFLWTQDPDTDADAEKQVQKMPPVTLNLDIEPD